MDPFFSPVLMIMFSFGSKTDMGAANGESCALSRVLNAANRRVKPAVNNNLYWTISGSRPWYIERARREREKKKKKEYMVDRVERP